MGWNWNAQASVWVRASPTRPVSEKLSFKVCRCSNPAQWSKGWIAKGWKKADGKPVQRWETLAVAAMVEKLR